MITPHSFSLLQVYRILLAHSPVVQPLSVDEAYLDLTGLGFGGPSSTEPQALVARIRQEIQAATGCTASAGTLPCVQVLQSILCSSVAVSGQPMLDATLRQRA
jgi:nucleotidyltransferase/DNA polymerase involved in DNA repair